ncbi:DsrE family protein [Ectothiorhodospiraceae bacterium 2226]|nr:DsrE family protein [Ectothiorhodospiraceae bacterium 2226]
MFRIAMVFLSLSIGAATAAAADAPWGSAQVVEPEYAKQKVVYDVAVGSPQAMEGVLDRASFLSVLNEADPFDHRIVLVLHGQEIHYFARQNFAEHEELMRRAQSLSVGDVVEFRLCGAAARMAGYEPEDIHGFVTWVPMADAEIVRLQHEGFAYMR